MINDKIDKVKVNISVMNGRIYEATDSNGLADGYVKIGKVHCEESKVKWFLKTPVQSKTLYPTWNYEHETIKLNLLKYKSLKVEVYDRDILSNDDFIGECEIDIQNIHKEDSTLTHSIYRKGKTDPTGNVWVLVQKKKL